MDRHLIDSREPSEEDFSTRLAEAVRCHDYNQCSAILDALERHLADRTSPHSVKAARTDLKTLRRKRQFMLMRRYADAVMASGTRDPQVGRQLGQALIELKEFERAIDVLNTVVADTTPATTDDLRNEQVEARSLIGRAWKQQYVDGGSRDGALIAKAIDAYAAVFEADEEQTWPGINAATCILCAASAGHAVRSPDEGRAIARQVLDVLARRERARVEQEKRLDVWDCATRVEALIDLGDFERAAAALDAYLVHPDMDSFEVSSTFRQFDEVLRLRESERGSPILERLASAAERLRSGGIAPMDEQGTRSMLVRVSNPDWTGAGIPGLTIHTRMGTILSVTGSAETVRALMKDPLVLAVDESRPGGQSECVRSLPFVNVLAEYPGPAGNYAERGDGALVAVIDNGIDVLHEAFLDEQGKSRIVGIWDQLDPGGTPPKGFMFGHYYSQDDIAAFVARTTPVPDPLKRPTDGHGTHVASIAAGRRTRSETFFGGVAPDAQILIVISRADGPTGYSHAHLAALTFIDWEATRLGKPVVVNVSQGMNAGAHDGQSPLEIAFDEFSKSGTREGRVIVKSAGNERSKRGHARLTVPPGGAETLTWRCPPGVPDVVMELWWSGINQYRFALKSPSGESSNWLERSRPDVGGSFTGRGPYRLMFVPNHPHNGHNLLKVSLTTGATPLGPSDWSLSIEAVKVPDEADILAWIERSGTRWTEFTSTHVSEDVTLSIPGTSRSVIAVAAVDANRPIVVGAFSSYGPTRDARNKPEIAAPGVLVRAAKAGGGDAVVEMSGTSMAAPHVAGAIALVLSKQAKAGGPIATASQLSTNLRLTAAESNSRWDRGRGYGVLDVAALLASF